MLALIVFALALTRVESAFAGRAYAAYGGIYIADKETTITALPADVCAAQNETTDCREERVFVRAQPEVKYNQFMEVMNELQGKGFYKVGLLNEDIE